jgi:hypothetical protein
MVVEMGEVREGVDTNTLHLINNDSRDAKPLKFAHSLADRNSWIIP